MTAPARYATAPTPGAAHETRTVETMARALGTPLMPWQSQVARVATERRADGHGWRYPTVVLTVPRQSGKTVLMRAVMAQRTLRYPGFQAFYTAQSGKDAKERWMDLADAVDKTCPSLVRIKRGAGAECVEWVNGHGQVRTFAPTRTALHGYTPELVMLDEAFAFEQELGDSLMAAIIPAQSTLSERQLWIVSTAGTAESTWLRDWVDRGREAVGDPLSAVAYFEWSAEPGLDLANPASFPLFHPAVGYTQDAETLVAARETMSLAEYERAFGNRWIEARSQIVIPTEHVTATINRDQAPPEDMRDVTLAYDVAPDRSAAAIWAAWTDHQGVHLRPYLAKPGAAWVIDAITDAADRLGVQSIWADDGGATRSVTDLLASTSAAHAIHTLKARDFATATGDLIDAITSRTVDHDGDPDLLRGLGGAALRRLGEADAWSRRESTGPIHAVVAATVAYHAHTHAPTAPTPMAVNA